MYITIFHPINNHHHKIDILYFIIFLCHCFRILDLQTFAQRHPQLPLDLGLRDVALARPPALAPQAAIRQHLQQIPSKRGEIIVFKGILGGNHGGFLKECGE